MSEPHPHAVPVRPSPRGIREILRSAAALALLAAVLGGGCKGSAPDGCNDPTGVCDFGDLVVRTTTTGQDLDPDGYDLLVDGTVSGSVSANGSRTLRIRAIAHTVSLDDVAGNCAIQGGGSRSVSVPPDGSVSEDFAVVCTSVVVPTPALEVAPSTLSFSAGRGEDPAARSFTVRNAGDGTMSWSASDDAAWLSLAPVSGSLGAGQSATVTVTVASAALAPGDYAGEITVAASDASGSPAGVSVALTVAPPGQEALAVTSSGDGSGTVTSSPAGIACAVSSGTAGGDCAASFDEGTIVTLSATASAGSEFAGWSGDCTGTGTCAVEMTGARNVEARFEALPDLEVSPTSISFSAQEGTSPAPVQITVRNAGGGTLAWSAVDDRPWLDVSPASGSLEAGQSQAVTVTASSDALTEGDYAGTVTVTGAGETVPVGATLRISAIPQRGLTVTGAGDGAGSVVSSPAGIDCRVDGGATSQTCAASFDQGTSVTLTATAAAGSAFGGWSGACSGVGTCTVAMSDARTVQATFVLLPVLDVTPTSLMFSAEEGTDPAARTVTVSNDGGGTLAWTASDDRDWLAASPASGSLGAGESATVTVTVASAALAPGAYDGTVTVSGAGDSRDVSVALTVSETPQWTLTVTGAGAGTGSVASEPPGIACDVVAGATSGSCAAPFDEGTGVTLTATPAAGSTFGGWSGACAGTGSCTVTMDAAAGVEARFDVETFTLTFQGAGDGFGTVTSDPPGIDAQHGEGATLGDFEADFTAGTSVTLTAVAGTATTFLGFSGSGCAGGDVCTVAMTEDRLVTGDFQLAAAPTIVTGGVPDGTYNRLYEQTLEASGGFGTLTWSVLSGSLPPGLGLSPGGVISGTIAELPAGGAPYEFEVLVEEEWFRTDTAQYAIGVTDCATAFPYSALEFVAAEGVDPPPQSVDLVDGCGGAYEFVATPDEAWIDVAPASDTVPADGSVSVTVAPAAAALAAGSYSGSIEFGLGVETEVLAVTLEVVGPAVPPTADFSSSCTGLVCDFTDLSTDPDGTVVAWSWDFGDGATSTAQNPQHSFATGGPHTIALVVTDDGGNGSGPAERGVNLTTPAQPGFQVEVRVSPGSELTGPQRAVVESAAARWEDIITGDIEEIPLVRSAGTCAGAATPGLDETVDDLVIYLEFEPIDGPGSILGSAGPCLVRGAGSLPLLGGMRFDTADLANLESQGRLEDVILHEMGHVLGFGTIWSGLGFLQDPTGTSGPSNDTHFDGPLAIAAFDDVSEPDYTAGAKVPVENDNQEPAPVFGAGSLNSHWRETVFGSELMSPAINFGANPLSLVTVESLGDLGYVVDPGAADAFGLSPGLVDPAQAGIALELVDDVWRGPIEVVDASGRTVDVLRP